MKFSVVDIETTGFSPKLGDKIIEISIINVDAEGNIIQTYESLVNPRRDVGASWVHGITAEMVVDAPSFNDIAAEVLCLLNDGVIVAHNARFDLGFLNFELIRSSMDLPELRGVCTLDLSRNILPDLPSHKLPVLCEYLDIEMSNAHTAYYDCLATANLFNQLKEQYVNRFGFDEFRHRYIDNYWFLADSIGPVERFHEFRRSHASEKQKKRQNRLQQMLLRLPDTYVATNVPIQEYLDILDDILADRIVTEEESEKLFVLSDEYNISRKNAMEIHEEYLRRLVRTYLLDNVITDSEYADLSKVAKILSLRDQLDLIIDLEKAVLPSLQKSAEENQQEYVGKSVCFTGQLISSIDGVPIDRKKAQELALQKGMVVKSGVSQKLDYLVVADPHTQSGKAKKARQVGTKIIAEPVFWRMLGVSVR